MKSRRRKILVAFLALVLGGLGFGAWKLYYQPKWELEAYKRQLIAAGEKLTIAEMTPLPLPAEVNGTRDLRKAMGLMNRGPSLLDTNPPAILRMVAPGKAMVGWQQPMLRDSLRITTTNSWAEAEQAIADCSEDLDALQFLTERSSFDFALEYSQNYSLLLPHLAPTKQAALRLAHAAMCDLHRGDAASAVKRLRALLAVANGLRDERLVVSQIVRASIVAIGVGASWELLQSPNLTDEQLATMQRDWSKLELVPYLENALGMERAMMEMSVKQMRGSSAGFVKIASDFGVEGFGSQSNSSNLWVDVGRSAKGVIGSTIWKSRETAWRVAWSYPDQLRQLKGNQILLECARLVRTNGSFDAALRRQDEELQKLGIRRAKDLDEISIQSDNLRTMLSDSISRLPAALKRILNVEISRQLVITAIALKRYHLRHGEYPASLNNLMPEFVAAIPRDPVDGQPLRYRRDGESSFLLYSINTDGKDDSGDPRPEGDRFSMNPLRGRDWVWPQPASAKEIEDVDAGVTERLKKKGARYAPRPPLNQ